MNLSQTRLAQLIQKLEEGEKQAFDAYLASPYFQVGRRSIQFWQLIKKDASWLGKGEELLFQSLFPGKAFHAQRLYEALHDLYGHLQQFLAIQTWQASPFEWEKAFLKKLEIKHPEKLFSQHYKAFLQRLQHQNRRDAAYFQQRYEFASLANEHYGLQQMRVPDKHLQEKATFLDIFYLATRLRDCCELLNRAHIFNAEFDPEEIARTWAFHDLQPEEIRTEPLIQVYRLVLEMLEEKRPEAFAELVEALNAHRDIFSKEEARALYKYAQNHCIRRINRGESIFNQALFRLYKSQLDNGMLYVSGLLSHTDYKNVVSNGLKLGEYTWMEAFMESQKEKLSPTFRDNVYDYCRAHLHFELGEWKAAIRRLQQIEFTDLHYQIGARYIIVRSYYELEDWDALSYQLPAFISFLKRNKGIPPQSRSYHLNFIRLLKQLARLKDKQYVWKTEVFQRQWQKLSDLTKELSHAGHADWIRAKVEGMGSSNK